MAKIAGRKNDGAWFRFNQWILSQPASVQTAFSMQLQASANMEAAFSVIQTYMSNTGIGTSAFPTSVAAWALELSLGVPRQIWEGVTTYDYYSKSAGPSGEDVYTKLMQTAIFHFSVNVRKIAKDIRFATFEVAHLAGLTHPGPSARLATETPAVYKARRRNELIAYQTANADTIAENLQKLLTARENKSITTTLSPRTAQPKRRK